MSSLVLIKYRVFSGVFVDFKNNLPQKDFIINLTLKLLNTYG